MWSRIAIRERRAQNEHKMPDWIRFLPAHRLHAQKTKIDIEASEMAGFEDKIREVSLFLTL